MLSKPNVSDSAAEFKESISGHPDLDVSFKKTRSRKEGNIQCKCAKEERCAYGGKVPGHPVLGVPETMYKREPYVEFFPAQRKKVF